MLDSRFPTSDSLLLVKCFPLFGVDLAVLVGVDLVEQVVEARAFQLVAGEAAVGVLVEGVEIVRIGSRAGEGAAAWTGAAHLAQRSR